MTAALSPADDNQDVPTFRDLVAAELRAHLARRQLSNRRLARILGTTPAWIDRRLNGTTAVDTDDLERIVGAIGIGLDKLLIDVARRVTEAPATSPVSGRYQPRSADVVALFPQVSAADKGGPSPLLQAARARQGEPRMAA